MEGNQAALEKFEVVKCGPCRFIGKSMYARAGSGELWGALWERSDWVFKALDGLKEYATEDVHNAGLVTWDKYDDKNRLAGYTVGRFMKADTPVPDGMDFIDIPEGCVVKGFIKTKQFDIDLAYEAVKEEVKRQGIYEAATWIWAAEIMSKPNADGDYLTGVYIACNRKTQINEE